MPTPSGEELKTFMECCLFALSAWVLVQKATGKGGIPQPMRTKAEDDPVLWPIWEKERDVLREEIHRLDLEHNQLAREVSAIGATLTANGVRLVQIDSKIDALLKRKGGGE